MEDKTNDGRNDCHPRMPVPPPNEPEQFDKKGNDVANSNKEHPLIVPHLGTIMARRKSGVAVLQSHLHPSIIAQQ